jgi:hypothetical protein
MNRLRVMVNTFRSSSVVVSDTCSTRRNNHSFQGLQDGTDVTGGEQTMRFGLQLTMTYAIIKNCAIKYTYGKRHGLPSSVC